MNPDPSLDNLLAVFMQDQGDEFAHGFFILEEQDGFAATANGQPGRGFFRLRFPRADVGDIDAKSGALADLAFDFNPALVLFDNAVNGGKAEAGALADVLGGEERLEDAGDVFLRDAAAGVGFADADEGADAGFGMKLDMGFVQFHHGNADAELPAARHGVAGIDRQIEKDLFHHAGVGFNGGG